MVSVRTAVSPLLTEQRWIAAPTLRVFAILVVMLLVISLAKRCSNENLY
jgi:hypothetical protein